MDLTAEQFADVLKSLGEGRKGALSDKRRAGRVTHRCRAAITPGSEIGAARPISVTVRDLSPRGICLVRAEEMPAGSHFIVALGRRGGSSIHILCTVVHCRTVSKNVHTIGAEFTCVVDAMPQQPVSAAAGASERDRIRNSVLD